MLPLSVAYSVNSINKSEENHHLLGLYDELGIILAYSYVLAQLNLTANVQKQKRECDCPQF